MCDLPSLCTAARLIGVDKMKITRVLDQPDPSCNFEWRSVEPAHYRAQTLGFEEASSTIMTLRNNRKKAHD
jgi:hypothetical protein